MKPRRWRAALPRYRTAIIIQRKPPGPAGGRGTNRVGTNVARVLRAFDTLTVDTSEFPSAAPPGTHFTAPGVYAPGWTAWWPVAPDSPASPYRIPDPPTMARPVLPTRALPILWEVPAEPGSAFWERDAARISAVYALCEWMPKTGKQMMEGMRELSINEASLKVRPRILETAGVAAGAWEIVRVSDNAVWKLESIVPSFRRGEFAELIVERT